MAFESADKCLLYDTVPSALSITPHTICLETVIRMIQFIHATAKLDVSSNDDLFHDLTFQTQGLLRIRNQTGTRHVFDRHVESLPIPAMMLHDLTFQAQEILQIRN